MNNYNNYDEKKLSIRMRWFYRNIVFLILIVLADFNTEAQVQVSGKVYSSVDSVQVVPFANVINLTKHKGTSADINGFFSIGAEQGDTLRFSSMGFIAGICVVNSDCADEPLNIFLETMVYNLNEVSVLRFKNYKEFKQAFIELKLPEEPQVVDLDYRHYENYEFPASNKNSASGMIVIPGPITALYNEFSKRGRELREYNNLIEKDKYKQELEKKYNIDIVKQVTGITDDVIAKNFIEYCHLAEKFIELASEYELLLAINQCYDEFLKSETKN